MALDAWTFSAPIGLQSRPGYDTLLMALGTEESTSLASTALTTYVPFNNEYDCALVTLAWNGAALSVADHWDDDVETGPFWPHGCDYTTYDDGSGTPVPDGVNGFVGEPIHVHGDRLWALRRRAELNRFEFDPATGALGRSYTVAFEGPDDDDVLRIPAEHSAVMGAYPDDPTKREIIFGMNDVGATRQAVFVHLDPTAYTCSGVDNRCVVSTSDHEVGTIDASALPRRGNLVWSPGALGFYRQHVLEPYEAIPKRLVYIVATGALANSAGPTTVGTVACSSSGGTWVGPGG